MGIVHVTVIGQNDNFHDCKIMMYERRLTSLIVAEAGKLLGVIKNFDA